MISQRENRGSMNRLTKVRRVSWGNPVGSIPGQPTRKMGMLGNLSAFAFQGEPPQGQGCDVIFNITEGV